MATTVHKAMIQLLLVLPLLLVGCRAKNQYLEVISSRTDLYIVIPIDDLALMNDIASSASGFGHRDASLVYERKLQSAQTDGAPFVVEIRIDPARFNRFGSVKFEFEDFRLALVDQKGQELALDLPECVAVRFPEGTAEDQKWLKLGPQIHQWMGEVSWHTFERKTNVQLLFLVPRRLDAKRAVLKFGVLTDGTYGHYTVGPFKTNTSSWW